MEKENEQTESSVPPNSSIKVVRLGDGGFELDVSSSICSLHDVEHMIERLKKRFIDKDTKKKKRPPTYIG